jgi:hypothetical protein
MKRKDRGQEQTRKWMTSLAACDEFTRVAIGLPLGPDNPEMIELRGKEILPALR